MRTHTDIVKDANPRLLAEAIRVNKRRVRSWMEMNSIPGRYWGALVRANAATLDELAAGAARDKP